LIHISLFPWRAETLCNTMFHSSPQVHLSC